MLTPSSIAARVRSYWKGAVDRERIEREMVEEFQHHLALRTEELIRSGVLPDEAARRARLEFGHIETTRADARASRGLRPQSYMSVLDLKLGWRALRKYPLLNLVAGIAMAFAIACAALVFEGVNQVLHPRLPLAEGDRVVGIRLWNAASSRNEEQSLYYYARWRNELRSIDELGAFSEKVVNVGDSAGRGVAAIRLAAITVSGFRVARVAPFMGRAFVETDERVGAPPVAILGYRLWQEAFGGDSALVGRSIRLAGTPHTVIGVMPEGFAFPIQHGLWVPLSVAASGHRPDRGPSIRMLGRLAPGVSLADAQRELTVLGARAAEGVPAEYETVRAQVMPYAKAIVHVPWDAGLGFRSVNIATLLLLILACGNVALLVFARAATRDTELAVRQALGASRGRIIGQLFAESLVLGAIAAATGLAVAGLAIRWVLAVVQMTPPFWFRETLSMTTVIYGALLAVLSAAITGALPAVRMTRDLGVQVRASAYGAGGLRLGRTLGFLMAAQVAVAVLFPVSTYTFRKEVEGYRSLDLGYPADQYAGVRLGIDGTTDSATAAAFLRTVRQRAEEQPGVTAVTFASALPGMLHPRVRFEIDAAGTWLRDSLHRGGTAVAAVDVDYFEAIQGRVRLGRGFQKSDLVREPRPVIVSESFVTFRLGGRNPIGWRLRYSNPKDPAERPKPGQEPGPWMEIIGVVNDLAMTNGGDPRPYPKAGFYQPMEPERMSPIHVAVRVQGGQEKIAQQLYAEAASIDPRLRVEAVFQASDIAKGELVLPLTLFWSSIVLSAMALLVSSAALYAVTSVIVRRRTQEIGVRMALGADARGVLAFVLRKPFVPVASGVLAGTALTILFDVANAFAVLGYGILMLAVCMAGCAVPALRAVSIKPMQALRTE